MKEIVPYLNFDGQTREAMTFYAKRLGGELYAMGYGDVPGGCAPEAKDRTMHARVSKDGRPVLMASDTPPGRAVEAGNNFHVSIQCESAEEMLGACRARLAHDRDTELRVAAGEQARITRLRLARLLEIGT